MCITFMPTALENTVLGPCVQLPKLIVPHESGCLAIWTLWQVSVHSYLLLIQHVEFARGLACR